MEYYSTINKEFNNIDLERINVRLNKSGAERHIQSQASTEL